MINFLNHTKKNIHKLIKAIIFDFDGVILNSTEIKTNAFINIFEKEYKKFLPKIIKHHNNNLGISRYNKIRIYLQEFIGIEFTKENIDLFANKFSLYCLKKILRCNFIPGVKKFLEDNLDEYLYFISSGTPTKELNYICKKRKINHYFQYIYGSPHTKTTHIKKISKKFNLKPNEIIFIGDSLSDYKIAKENNLNFIGINYKKNLNIKNELIINNFNEINFSLKKIYEK